MMPWAVTWWMSSRPSGATIFLPTECDGIDAHRQARQPPHHRHVGEVDEVAVRIAEVGLHAAQAEDDAVVAAEATYSQAFSDSSSVMPMPRLNSTGNSCC